MKNQRIFGVIGCCGMLFVSVTMGAQTAPKTFSADQVFKVGTKTLLGRVFATGNAMRMEGQDNGKQYINIVRADRKVVWSLVPDRMVYIEIPLNGPLEMSSMPPEPGVQNVRHTHLGSEQIAAYLCDKSRVEATANGKTVNFIEWAAKDLNGFVVKREDDKGLWSVEYRNVHFGAQDPSLFEIPAGYRKMSLNGMGH